MSLKVASGRLDGVLRIEPAIFRDRRGSFAETYRLAEYASLGLPAFVQDNIAVSNRGVLRGLHFQFPNAQGKLIHVVTGSVFDVAVDVRTDSATFGQWEAVELSADNLRQLYIPPGFAHGYQALSDLAVIAYKCTAYYDPAAEFALSWHDPALSIPWPISNPQCSEKDQHGLPLAGLPTAPAVRAEAGAR